MFVGVVFVGGCWWLGLKCGWYILCLLHWLERFVCCFDRWLGLKCGWCHVLVVELGACRWFALLLWCRGVGGGFCVWRGSSGGVG